MLFLGRLLPFLSMPTVITVEREIIAELQLHDFRES